MNNKNKKILKDFSSKFGVSFKFAVKCYVGNAIESISYRIISSENASFILTLYSQHSKVTLIDQFNEKEIFSNLEEALSYVSMCLNLTEKVLIEYPEVSLIKAIQEMSVSLEEIENEIKYSSI